MDAASYRYGSKAFKYRQGLLGDMVKKIHSDVAVIGGGVIGSSVGYWLSKKGFDTVLLEKKTPASGASGSCDGFIFLQSKKDTSLTALAKESISLFKYIKDRMPLDIEFEECGGMVLFKDRESLQSFLDGCPVRDSVKILEGKDITRYEKKVSKRIKFATLNISECQINPLNLNLALIEAAVSAGLRLLKKTPVERFDVSGGRVEAIYAGKDIKIIPRYTVLCAGAWTGIIAQKLGLDIPVIPRKGMIAVTEEMPVSVGHVILDYDYICCKFEGGSRSGFSIEQTSNGNILLGSTRQFAGFDTDIDIRELSTFVKNAILIFPFLKEVSVIRTFAGLRPYSSTGLPIIGPSSVYEDLFIASGHEGDGIALSPVTGDIIARMITQISSGKKTSTAYKGISLEGLLPAGF